MAGKKKTRGGKPPTRKTAAAKRPKPARPTADKAKKNKKIAASTKAKSKAGSKSAKATGHAAARHPARSVGGAGKRAGKARAGKRIAGTAIATLRKPVPRKTPPRSIAARRAAPSPSPRNPAAARPILPSGKAGQPVARPPLPTTPSAQVQRPPLPKPVAKPGAPQTGMPAGMPGLARPAQPRPPAPPKPATTSTPKTGVKLSGRMGPGYDSILTTQAIDFVVGLERRFRPDIKRLLAAREDRQRRLDAGEKPDFLPETVNIRNGDWTVAPLPRDLNDRRVELLAPVDRRMALDALNSGASCYVADFEDATSPTLANLVDGQINLRDAVAGSIGVKENGRDLRLNPRVAVLIVRPRGLHLPERHLVVDGEPVAGALFDFGLFFFHNARPLIRNGTGPYFYLPKLESHHEARLWNEVFLHAQRAFGLPRGTIKATVAIETLPAAFEMDEILYELRDHAAGLNLGRWDYVFSFTKKLRNDRSKLLPDRAKIAMAAPFLRAYAQLLIKTCHRREVPAIGGMAAPVALREDGHLSHEALDRLRQEKEREALEGHDGTWVAYPALVPSAKAALDKVMPHANQIARRRPDVQVTAHDLLQAPQGTRTEAGLRQNTATAIAWIEAWLRGQGRVAMFGNLEDAAVAEASRAQVWQWARHNARLEDGRHVNVQFCRQVAEEETAKLRQHLKPGQPDRLDDAMALFLALVEAPDCVDFMTLKAYEKLAD